MNGYVCEPCGGTGYVEEENSVCFFCGGSGWIEPEDTEPEDMVNWYQVQVYAFTVIRAEFSVNLLRWMASAYHGFNETPVSGSALARAKSDLRKLGR